MNKARAFNPKDFRNALGMFATGVTIVTARADNGEAVGVTANSFNSVSMQPPLVLWSLAKNARSLPVFSGKEYWNVHILSNQQETLSNRFARSGEDKFSGLALDAGISDAPLLPDCSARFQCRTMFQYEGGDHIIFVGEVIDYNRTERPPLLYVTGGYALATRKSGAVSTEPQADMQSSLFSEDMLGYLLGRAHYQFLAGIRPMLDERRLSDADFFVLSLLSVREPLTAEEIATHIAYTGININPLALQMLCGRNLLRRDDAAAAYRLAGPGRDAILHLLAAAKGVEADLLARMGELEAASLRNLLKTMILCSDPGLPKLWTADARPAG
jgi:3-hydroxy-9,10-secoandrosta-1,3,5(10)-triene-9,17-dione monooxygenase reductase component